MDDCFGNQRRSKSELNNPLEYELTDHDRLDDDHNLLQSDLLNRGGWVGRSAEMDGDKKEDGQSRRYITEGAGQSLAMDQRRVCNSPDLFDKRPRINAFDLLPSPCPLRLFF